MSSDARHYTVNDKDKQCTDAAYGIDKSSGKSSKNPRGKMPRTKAGGITFTDNDKDKHYTYTRTGPTEDHQEHL